jgi:amino acid transporter
MLRRTLGFWRVTISGIGIILGAGVYALVGPAAGLAGNALWLAFLLAAIAAGLTAYSYARLGTMRPKDPPEFQYTALAFGPRVGFVGLADADCGPSRRLGGGARLRGISSSAAAVTPSGPRS